MEPYPLHGFIVQNSAIPLDLCVSRDYFPVSFITSENNYNSTVQDIKDRHLASGLLPAKVRNAPITYWEYYDDDRQNFEENLFQKYEESVFGSYSRLSLDQVRNYLKLCNIMGRCSDLQEAERIYSLVSKLLFENCNDSSLIVELLETVCLSYDALFLLWEKIGSHEENFEHLNYILSHMRQMNFNSWGLWPGCSGILTDYNLVSFYFHRKNYAAISILLKHGLQPAFCEEVLVEYCKKVIHVSWSGENSVNQSDNDFRGLSKERLLLILQLFTCLNDWRLSRDRQCLEALTLYWRAIADPFITHTELFTTIYNNSSPPVHSLTEICKIYRTVWPNCKTQIKPRSLQHLSRSSIRNRLAENFQLPEGISELRTPPYLDAYLRLEF